MSEIKNKEITESTMVATKTYEESKYQESRPYEESIAKLQEIIQAFQKGNMLLNEAVHKYLDSQKLLTSCKERLESFQKAIDTAADKENKDNILLNNKDTQDSRTFEENLNELEEICLHIERDNKIPLDKLEDMYKKGIILIEACKKELEDFQHVISYHQVK